MIEGEIKMEHMKDKERNRDNTWTEVADDMKKRTEKDKDDTEDLLKEMDQLLYHVDDNSGRTVNKEITT